MYCTVFEALCVSCCTYIALVVLLMTVCICFVEPYIAVLVDLKNEEFLPCIISFNIVCVLEA